MSRGTLRFIGLSVGVLVLALVAVVAMVSVMPVWADEDTPVATPTPYYGYGSPANQGFPVACPGGWGYPGGMMGYGYGPMMGYGYGYGPMMGYRYGGMSGSGFYYGDPLTVEEVEDILKSYLERLGIEGLAVREIMIFDNHAYAQIVEEDTGMGAWEVLIDPVTKVVYPEYGPTRMWNLKYGVMSGWAARLVPSASLPKATISPEKAIQLAQDYLARVLPGATAEEPVPFYGYYTLHVVQDGEVVGMLSVHAYTGAVFPHVWHGQLVTMVETEHHTD